MLNSPDQGKDENIPEEPFAVTLSKLLLVKFHELREKLSNSTKNAGSSSKNMLMIISYTLFAISGS